MRIKDKQNITEKESAHLTIRQATRDDIDSLVDICRKSFPWLVRWQAPRFLARKNWEHILASAAAETWVCSSEGQVAALVTLVSDMTVYKREKHPPYTGPLKKLCSNFLCPTLLVKKILRRTCRLFYDPYKCLSTVLSQSKNTSFTWIELLAVAPHMRKKGMATTLLELCYKKTVQLKMEEIKLSVNSDNTAARKLYENFGFLVNSQKKDHCIYTMKTTSESLP